MNSATKNQLLTLAQRVMILLWLPAILLLSNCDSSNKVDTTILKRKATKEELNIMVERLQETKVNKKEFLRIKADVKKVDSLWIGDPLRIPAYNEIEKDPKYINSRQELWDGKVKEPPKIGCEWTTATDNKLILLTVDIGSQT